MGEPASEIEALVRRSGERPRIGEHDLRLVGAGPVVEALNSYFLTRSDCGVTRSSAFVMRADKRDDRL
jgi:hypothetical protein